MENVICIQQSILLLFPSSTYTRNPCKKLPYKHLHNSKHTFWHMSCTTSQTTSEHLRNLHLQILHISSQVTTHKYPVWWFKTEIKLVDAQECSALAYELVMLHQWHISSKQSFFLYCSFCLHLTKVLHCIFSGFLIWKLHFVS